MNVTHILISFLAGIAGGFIGGVTGGAGILSIPVLIFLGLSTDAAIATNSITGFGIVASALPRYAKAGQVRWRIGFMLVPLSLLGGFLGAGELVRVNPGTLTTILGVLLLLLIPVVLLNPKRGLKPVQVSRSVMVTGCLIYFLTMLYSGFVGAGGAVFAMYALIYFFGMTYIQAKSTITVSTIFLVTAELPVFLLHGLVDFRLGIPMTAGMYIGAGFGARTALRKGNTWVRAFFVIVVAVSATKLLFFR